MLCYDIANSWEQRCISCIVPVNSLNADGNSLSGVTQKISDLLTEYSPGSTIRGLALFSLQAQANLYNEIQDGEFFTWVKKVSLYELFPPQSACMLHKAYVPRQR